MYLWHDWQLCSQPYHDTLLGFASEDSRPPWAEALGTLDLCTNQLERPPIPLASGRYLPPTSWGSSSGLCSQLCEGNDSCTFFPVTSDAFRQVRQTFCLI